MRYLPLILLSSLLCARRLERINADRRFIQATCVAFRPLHDVVHFPEEGTEEIQLGLETC